MNVLVINCGSSSLKYQLFDMTDEHVLAKGLAERIGEGNGAVGHLTHQAEGKPTFAQEVTFAHHEAALAACIAKLTDAQYGAVSSLEEINAVGHRVVHGGEHFSGSVIIDEEVLTVVRECIELAPLHNPPNLEGIEAAQHLLPHCPQIAVFDTAFHATLPPHAYHYAIPKEYYEKFGIRRYGFHGTSHRFVSREAERLLGAPSSPEGHRLVTVHLGNGCSISAVKGGKCVDTSMGMTPLEGLVMGTRSGDVDPALVQQLADRLNTDAAGVTTILNKKSGLLGLSGISNDMRDLLDSGDDNARLAVDVFCYRIRKYIGAYAAAMGGLDAVVFTAGIGENAPVVREKVCRGLEFLGAELDPDLNNNGSGTRDISRPDARCRLLVVATNEELLIARDTKELLSNGARL